MRHHARHAILLAALVLAPALAGCADADGPTGPAPTPGLGVVRGVVVDAAIRPIEGAQVHVVTAKDKVAVSGADGSFRIDDVPPGEHRVQAAHQLYRPANAIVAVQADVPEPRPVRLLMEQFVFARPYMSIQKEEGFISCSLSQGTTRSEECGEGVGDPDGNRVGKNDNSRPQVDFFVDGPAIRTIIVEQVWEPNAQLLPAEGFHTVLATEWACTPGCSGNELVAATGTSPLLLRVDAARLAAINVTDETRFSTFTWADGEPGVVLEQDFELIVSTFYHLPAPEGWSFVAGSPDPF